MTNPIGGYVCVQNIAFSLQRYKKSADYTKKMKKIRKIGAFF
jgi:hypothetical protein